MAVVVGVAGKRDVERSLHVEQAPHRIRRGRIHADLPVPVDGHEAEGRIDLLADDLQVEPVVLGDARPVVDAGAAERVHAEVELAGADRIEVDDVAEIGDVGAEVVVAVGGARPQRARVREALDVGVRPFEHCVGLRLDPRRDIGAGGPAVRRVVLEAAVVGRVVRGRDDDAVGKSRCAAPVVHQDRVRHRRRRRVFVPRREHHVDAVGREHLEGAGRGGLGQGVGVDAEKERTVDAVLRAPAADRLRDRQHVALVEGGRQRAAAVPRGAERDPLRRDAGVGLDRVVGRDEPRHVDEHRERRELSGQGTEAGGHGDPSTPAARKRR